MAAAIIPIIAAAAPLLTPLIKELVVNAQKLFGHNQGTGSTKAQTVIDATLSVAEKLATAGKIPGVLTAESVAIMVENIVQQLKANGTLPTDNPRQTSPVETQLTSSGKAVRFTGVLEVL